MDTQHHKQHADLFELTRGFRRLYLASIAAMAVGIVLSFVVPIVVRGAIDAFVQNPTGVTAELERSGYDFKAPEWIVSITDFFGLPDSTMTSLVIAGLAVVLLTALSGLFQYLKGRWAAHASEAIVLRLRNTLHEHLAALPARFFDQSDTGDLIQRCTSDVETVRVFMAAQVVEIARSILLVLCVMPVLFSMDPRLACVTLALLPIIVVFSTFFFKRLTAVFTAVEEAEGRMTTVLQENLTGIRVVRSFGRGEFEEKKFGRANDAHRDKTYRLMLLLSGYWSFSDVICLTQGGLVLFFGAWWTMTGEISLGTMVAFTMYSAYVIWPVRQMGRTLVDAGKARVSLKRLREVLSVPREDAEDVTAQNAPSSLKGALRVSGLRFNYGLPDKAKKRAAKEAAEHAVHDVLKGIDFELEAGQTLALLGPPGSGKSTLVQLLLRLYDYDGEGGSGSIQIDGHELAGLPRDFVRKEIGVVLQNPFLYARTLNDNLRVGHGSASADEVQAATEAAAIHTSIEEFEEGYSTMLGERGVTLSGGQKQRVAIARALLKKAPILVLDDALSAVDTETEQLILRALKARRGCHTTILIAHRLSSVTHADLILIFDEGRIVERGSHTALLSQGGVYARLWAIQNAYHADIDGQRDDSSESEAQQ